MKVPYSKIHYTTLKPSLIITDLKGYIEEKVKNKETFNLFVLVDESKHFPIFCNLYNFDDDDIDVLQTETVYIHPHDSTVHYMGDNNGYNNSLYEKLEGKEVFTIRDIEKIKSKTNVYEAITLEGINWTDYVK